MKIKAILLYSCLIVLIALACNPVPKQDEDVFSYALRRKDDLKLSIYITAQAVEQLLASEEGRREALSILKANGITTTYIEVYRSGMVVKNDLLKSVTAFFKDNGFEVVGGIATVPGGNFGKAQDGRFSWFNWQNKKTVTDLEKLMTDIAPIFDAFIVDDFLCTSDTSLESKAAKKDLSWTAYRQNLLVDFSEKYLIGAAKKVNPQIQMIIKYPQWYDRYHLFGYDVVREPAIYDQVAIGTETRGQYTKRFGFVQPYEGFVNYRWMSSLSGKKMRAAWFDHIDCVEPDFIDQAYQSVLGGAQELILFNYFNYIEGHPGQHRLRLEFNHLADLAATVAKNPVYGPAGYKPSSSEAGGDMYIMDFIGMLGIPLIPHSQYPENSDVIFLPTQAAGDTATYEKIKKSLDRGTRIIMTSGFLSEAIQGKELAEWAGVAWPIETSTINTQTIVINKQNFNLDSTLQIGANYKLTTATADLEVVVNGQTIPYLSHNTSGNVYVFNAHTYSDADFQSVGEGLLSPYPLGILELPVSWTNTIRSVFNGKNIIAMEGDSRVTLQPFGKEEWMIQNYNPKETKVLIGFKKPGNYIDVLSGDTLKVNADTMSIKLSGRSRKWIKGLNY